MKCPTPTIVIISSVLWFLAIPALAVAPNRLTHGLLAVSAVLHLFTPCKFHNLNLPHWRTRRQAYCVVLAAIAITQSLSFVCALAFLLITLAYHYRHYPNHKDEKRKAVAA